MEFWFWIILAFISTAFITLVRKKYDYSMLYTIAIGYAINANLFNASTAPIIFGSLIFSVDSILYTGFMFCVLVCAHEYSVRNAKILTSSSIAAIILSATIEILAKTSSTGFESIYLINFLSYVFSALGTFAGVWLMLYIYTQLKNKNCNNYLNFTICIIIASIVNSSIFYIFTRITAEDISTLPFMLIGSYLGKFFCIGLCLISFYISTHLLIPNNLKDKYGDNLKKDK